MTGTANFPDYKFKYATICNINYMLLTVNIEAKNVFKYFLNLKISLFNFGLLFLSVKVRQGIRRVGWCCRGKVIGTDGAGLCGKTKACKVLHDR